MIHQFYVVTMTSVYHVRDGINKKGNCCGPEAEKIALKGESKVPVGHRLKGGRMVAICDRLIMYIPEGGGMTSFQRKIEMVNTNYWGGCTSSIVSLFLVTRGERKRARECFRHDDIEPCDPRWLKDTQEVLDKIGDSHPVFEICRHHGLCLPIFEKQVS